MADNYLMHWKYVRKEKVGDSWRYYYKDEVTGDNMSKIFEEESRGELDKSIIEFKAAIENDSRIIKAKEFLAKIDYYLDTPISILMQDYKARQALKNKE
jgi:hypothetical protein